MQEVKEHEKQFKAQMDHVDKNYGAFIKILNGKRPPPYMEAKYLEVYEYVMKSANVLNKLHRQLLQMKYDINKKKAANDKDDPVIKEETDKLVIKLFDLTQVHKITKERWLTKVNEMTTRKISPHWGFAQLEYWGKFRASCESALSRVI